MKNSVTYKINYSSGRPDKYADGQTKFIFNLHKIFSKDIYRKWGGFDMGGDFNTV